MLRYGVPVNYEDVSSYAFEAGRRGRLTVNFTERSSAPKPADPQGIARLLQALLEQNESEGNPGLFKLVDTDLGVTIVPTATRNGSGQFIPDPSLLDTRISFPEVSTDFGIALSTFCQALSAASGKSVVSSGGYMYLAVRIGAKNEIARDVLVKLISGVRRTGGLMSGDFLKAGTPVKPSPIAKIVWRLITEPGIETPSRPTYRLDVGEVVMERPGPGHSTDRIPVWRVEDPQAK